MFLPNFLSLWWYSESLGGRWRRQISSFCHHQVPVESLEKLDICHVRRPVSRDRRILAMEMEAGKPAQVAYLILII